MRNLIGLMSKTIVVVLIAQQALLSPAFAEEKPTAQAEKSWFQQKMDYLDSDEGFNWTLAGFGGLTALLIASEKLLNGAAGALPNVPTQLLEKAACEAKHGIGACEAGTDGPTSSLRNSSGKADPLAPGQGNPSTPTAASAAS